LHNDKLSYLLNIEHEKLKKLGFKIEEVDDKNFMMDMEKPRLGIFVICNL